MAGFPDEQQLREYEALVAAEIREQNERVGVRIGSWRPLTDGERDVAASASTSMSTSASGMDMEMEMGFELNAQSRSRSRSQLRQTPQEEVEQFSRELEQFNLQYNEVMNSLQGDGTLNSVSIRNPTGVLAPPAWYAEMRLPTRPVAHSRSILSAIQCLRKYIMNLEHDGYLQGGSRTTHYQAIRDEVHKLELCEVNEYLLKKSRILDSHNGLSSIFWKKNGYPWDIRADARQLYKKWAARDFSCDIYKGYAKRGPQGSNNGNGNGNGNSNSNSSDSDSNSNSYNNSNSASTSDSDSPRSKKSKDASNKAAFHGNGKYVNGQWWPNQTCAWHDGIHGHHVGGISGAAGHGAFSVVLSGTSYPDKDSGSSIWYYGTAGPREHCTSTTGATDHLLSSMRAPPALRKPVRVLRSQTLPKANLYRPARGIRYDGLYDVVNEEYVDAERQVYCFLLERCPGQDPIRYKGVEARPTPFEIDAYDLTH